VGVLDNGEVGFFGPKKLRHNRRKIKLQTCKIDQKTFEFMRYYYLFGVNWHEKKKSQSQDTPYQVVTVKKNIAGM
jgi:hypothetical protein